MILTVMGYTWETNGCLAMEEKQSEILLYIFVKYKWIVRKDILKWK